MSASFAALQVRNYRRFYVGQTISVSGTWMQTVAEAWLVLQLTHSGFALGVAAALQFLPMLLFGAWGGVLADRLAKHRVLQVTQVLAAAPALLLWGLAATGTVELWMLFVLMALRGTVLAVDNPTRQSFIPEMVGPERVVNAVALNSVLVQTARIAGPAAAALVIATLGVSTCFLLNAASFGAMLVALRGMDPALLHPTRPAARARGQVREAVRVVRADVALWLPLLQMALVGTLAFNFTTTLPLLAADDFDGGAATYALLTSVMGAGAVAGALVTGARGRTSPLLVAASSALFGLGMALVAAAPSLGTALAALVLVGAASVTFTSSVNAALQLAAPPAVRGRVMALYAVVFLGSTPIGAPLIGLVDEAFGARTGLGVGAVAALVAGLASLARLRRERLAPARALVA